MNENSTKEELLEEISLLIGSDGSSTSINPDLLKYLDLEELLDMRDNLIRSKEDYSDVLDDIFLKNS
ncbi:MAG: hypothetical protein U9N30_02090 [Campylobacterota bacterium]|nr:hypothetical protein [Campylobacterota bacterium]